MNAEEHVAHLEHLNEDENLGVLKIHLVSFRNAFRYFLDYNGP